MKKIVLLAILTTICSCKSNHTDYETIEKNNEFRENVLKKNTGKYAVLADGYTYFEQANQHSLSGTIILVHGWSVPSYIWKLTFESLKEKGYHVVMLDLYGRGNSDNPNLPQTDALRAKQVVQLANTLKISKAIFVGLSNGGRIISKIADLAPEKVQGLCYVGSSSFQEHATPTNTKVSAQEIKDFIAGYPSRSAGQLEDFYRPENFPDWPYKYEPLLQHKGFAKALLSTDKNLVSMDAIHQKIHQSGIPVYTFWGAHDNVVVYADFKQKLNALLPNRTEYFIPNAGHLPHLENQKVFEGYFLNALATILN